MAQDGDRRRSASSRSKAGTSEQFHLHVNCFTERLPSTLEDLVRGGTFKVKFFTNMDRYGEGPLWIATRKLSTAEDADRCFEETITALEADNDMLGYVETESVLARNVVRFQNSAYRPDIPFVERRWTAHGSPRTADIHVFRSIGSTGDVLDRRLIDAGFYEVVGNKERIWTLLVGKREDAESMFDKLVRHVGEAGGVTKVELEYVRKIRPVPEHYILRPVFEAAQADLEAV